MAAKGFRHLAVEVADRLSWDMAIDRPLRDITTADIVGLLDARRREDRTTEYKGHWSGDPDAMLKPISAFANTDGGDLIFGIVAKDSIPTDAPGIESNEVEQAMVRSMQLARSGLQPPLPLRNVNFQPVALGNGRMVLILRVPPSWAQPHQIRSTNVFYGRNSTESYRLDTTELRQRFLMADSIHTQARGFIESRIAQISRTDALPVPTPSPKLAFHIVPLSAFPGQHRLEISSEVPQLLKFLPLECYSTSIIGGNYSRLINLEGWVNYYQRRQQITTSYTQVYRDGTVEAVLALDVHPDRPVPPGGIFSAYEVKLALALRQYVTLMKELLVEPPFLLSLAFLNAQAYYLLSSYGNSAQPFDRGIIILPDMVVTEPDFNTDITLLSLFDMAWQAAGTERSPRNMSGQFQLVE